MASISRRLFLQRNAVSWRIPPRHSAFCAAQWHRPISTSVSRLADKPPQGAASDAPKASKSASKPTVPTIEEDEVAQLEKIASDLENIGPHGWDRAVQREGAMQMMDNHKLENEEDFQISKEPFSDGFWAEGEPELGPDEDYYGDDLTSLGHGELEQHREIREYARLAAWELPLLSELAKPFTPPGRAQPFRFRYTSYLGESHPAINKVVVEFSVKDIRLTDQQRNKLIKLAGVRYNPDTNIIKMSCEDYTSQQQNKRFLAETIKTLIDEAKDPKDTFEDVPFDFRHHKPRVFHEFPKEWILTPERKQYLEDQRNKAAQLEVDRRENGKLVDGLDVIQKALPYVPEAIPALIEARPLKARR